MWDVIKQNNQLMNLLVQENKELKDHNQELVNVIKETLPKIGNNNNTQFNLQVFLNEDCKDAMNLSEFIDKIQISFDDLENQAQLGYEKGISKVFIENLKELGKHKRPIHCTDTKRKLYILKKMMNGINKVLKSLSKMVFKNLLENHINNSALKRKSVNKSIKMLIPIFLINVLVYNNH